MQDGRYVLAGEHDSYLRVRRASLILRDADLLLKVQSIHWPYFSKIIHYIIVHSSSN